MKYGLVASMIAKQARQYIGYREKPGNRGFLRAAFQEAMYAVGWRDTHPWCVYFCELVWTEFYTKNDDRKLPDIKRLFTGGAVRTWKRFVKDPNWTTSYEPVVGGVLIFQTYKNGKPQTTGHAAISTSSSSENLKSIDGNTNDKGGREGYIVAVKYRPHNQGKQNGLIYLGCIHPQHIKQ